MTNNAAKRQLFQSKMNASQPVTMTNVNVKPSGAAFFNVNADSRLTDAPFITFKADKREHLKLINLKDKRSGRFTINGLIKWTDEQKLVETKSSSTNQSDQPQKANVRDGFLADDTYHFPFSAWEKFIPMIEEGKPYCITNVQMRMFQGRPCLSTTIDSVLTSGEAISVDMQEVATKFTTQNSHIRPSALTICCPDILAVKVDFYPICRLKKCFGKRVTIIPGEGSAECPNCKRSMKLTKCQCAVTAEIVVQKDERNISLTTFAEPLNDYFQEDVIAKYKNTPIRLKDLLLDMEHVDIQYNAKKVISKITPHNQDK